MTEKVRTGYKVVRDWMGTYTSIYQGLAKGGRIYRTHEWTEPMHRCGPLCVFNRRSAAFLFIGNAHNTHILKCRYIKAKAKRAWDQCHSKAALPKGTVLAKKVMLVEG